MPWTWPTRSTCHERRRRRRGSKGTYEEGRTERDRGKTHLRVVALPHLTEVFRASDIEPLDGVLALDYFARSEANRGRDSVRQLVLEPKEQSGLAGIVKAQQQDGHVFFLSLLHPS